MLTSCFIGPTWSINIKQMQSRHKYKIIEDQVIKTQDKGIIEDQIIKFL